MVDKVYGLTAEQSKALAAVRDKVNAQSSSLSAAQLASYRPAPCNVIIGVLTAAVKYDTSASPSTWPGRLAVYRASVPDSTTVETASGETTFIVWPWDLDNGTTIPIGTKVKAFYAAGRWYVDKQCCQTFFQNTDESDCPPYAVMELSGSDAIGNLTYLLMEKPTGSVPFGMDPLWYINTGVAVASSGGYSGGGGDIGEYQDCSTFWAQYSTNEMGLRFLEQWGPIDGSWQLQRGYPGFRWIGSTATKSGVLVMLVVRDIRPPACFEVAGDADIEPYGVVVMSSDGSTETGNVAMLNLEQAATDFPWRLYVNDEYSLNSGQVGRYQTGDRDGWVWAQYSGDSFGAPVDGEEWGPAPNEQTLSRNYYGFITDGLTESVTIGEDSYTLLHVKPRSVWRVPCKLDGTLSRGGIVNGHVQIVTSPGDPTFINSGYTLEDLTDWNAIPTGSTFPSGTYVWVERRGDRWWVMDVDRCAGSGG